MSIRNVRLASALAVGLLPINASAQHEGHQMTATQPASAELTQCLRVQPAIEKIITAAMVRAEAARLSNSPPDLRAAIEHLEAALRDIRTQSAPCAAAAVPADPHAGHAMPSTEAPSSPSAASSAAKQIDPVNGVVVDPAAAPKTTYQGQTYYFSSEKSRKEFLENPAKFAKKPKG
jgi:YHS domain-containing protein